MVDSADSTFERLPIDAKRRVDAVCMRFEQAWQHGPAEIETYQQDVPEAERSILLEELLQVDIECRRRAGLPLRFKDYLDRFPAKHSLLSDLLPAEADPTSEGMATLPGTPPGEAPSHVPGYQMLEELGRGGMGLVRKARHLALKRLVALKFILAGNQAQYRYRDRFRHEAQVVAHLRHPNIIQIYEIGEVSGQLFLALEYAEGGSLRQRLEGKHLESRTAAAILEPIARAIQHAHRRGVIHRDIKPANVLLIPGGDSILTPPRQPIDYRQLGLELPQTADMLPPIACCTPKLTDFGLARTLAEEAEDQGMTAGTPNYMAPEQIAGSAEVGPASDIWALGATLYELLTGRPPFQATTAEETLQLVLDATPVPPSKLQAGVHRDLESICLKCLEKEPGARYAGARELAQDLRSYLDGDPVEARSPTQLERLRLWVRRQPLVAGLLTAGGLLVLGGVIGALIVLFG